MSNYLEHELGNLDRVGGWAGGTHAGPGEGMGSGDGIGDVGFMVGGV